MSEIPFQITRESTPNEAAEAKAFILDCIKTSDRNTRIDAIVQLGWFHFRDDPEVKAVLLDILSDESADDVAQARASEVLKNFQGNDVTQALLKVFNRSLDQAIEAKKYESGGNFRTVLAGVLYSRGGTEKTEESKKSIKESLTRALNDTYPTTIGVAAWGLGELAITDGYDKTVDDALQEAKERLSQLRPGRDISTTTVNNVRHAVLSLIDLRPTL